MHLWLLFQRLRDFSHNKFAHQLKEELIENFNRIIKHEMDTVEVLKRYKKVEQIDNYLQAIRNNLDFHFHINGVSVEQPEFKLDALVWTCIFHEKVPRYSDVVYRMACYLLEHYKYLKTLQYTDIESCMVDWSVSRVPFNPRERFTRLSANQPLSLEEFEKEYDSPYLTKKYHYNFRLHSELADGNLKQTYINLTTKAHFENKDKTVRIENLNLDTMQSKEREEVVFRMKRELEQVGTLADSKDEYFIDLTNPNPIHTQFKLWRKNLMIPLTD